MSEHTPGPWYLIDDEYGVYRYLHPAVYDGTDNVTDNPSEARAIIATLARWGYPTETGDEATANARLIASAPDLLEACKAVINYRFGKGGYNFSHLPKRHRETASFEAWCDIEKQLESAIKKAEGEHEQD